MMSFMTFVVIILLNMLIAMMAETYTLMADKSFANYCLGFGKLLIQRRQNYYTGSSPPLNLLSVPYEIGSRLWKIVEAMLPRAVKKRICPDQEKSVCTQNDQRTQEEQDSWEVPAPCPNPRTRPRHKDRHLIVGVT